MTLIEYQKAAFKINPESQIWLDERGQELNSVATLKNYVIFIIKFPTTQYKPN